MSLGSSASSLSFAGTLSGSLQYERRSQRLPPVDPEHLTFMSRRRVQAEAALQSKKVEDMEAAEQLARNAAERRRADLEAWRTVDHSREHALRSARRMLLQSRDGCVAGNGRSSRSLGGMQHSKSAQQLAEAVRETARNCQRKEELHKLRLEARQASELASKRRDLLENQRQLEEQALADRTKREEAWLQRKMDFEEARLKGMLSSAAEREQEKLEVERRRTAHEAMLKDAWDTRAKEREARAQEKKAKAEAAEMEREAADERRRKEKEALKLVIAANRAAELARAAEQVWIQADALAARCQSDVDRKVHAARVLNSEPSAEEMERLSKRLEVAQARVASAKLAFDEQTAAAVAAEKRARESVPKR